MEWSNLFLEIWTQLIVAMITFLIGFFVSKMPSSINKYKIRKFFGAEIFGDDFKIAYGTFSRIEDKYESQGELASYYQKIYSNNTVHKTPGPYLITTQDALRGISYFLQDFSKYRKKPFTLCTDTEALSYKDTSFLSIGGPIINELTDLALQEENNRFFRFPVSETPTHSSGTIELIENNEKFKKPNEKGHDYGIILKVKNSGFPKKYYFVCAGIGSLGTSAAVWYLTHYWEELYREFKSNEFGIMIEVTRDLDHMAKRVYPKKLSS